MKPETIGRVLGTGMRVAGRMAGQRLSGSTQAGAAAGAAHRGPAQAPVGKRLARGVGGFLRPFSAWAAFFGSR